MPGPGCSPQCLRQAGLWSNSGRRRSEGCSGRRRLFLNRLCRPEVLPPRSGVRSWKRRPAHRCGIGPAHPSDGWHGNTWGRVCSPREFYWRTLPPCGVRPCQRVADRLPALSLLLRRLLLLALCLDHLYGHRLRQYLRHGGLLRIFLRLLGLFASVVFSTHGFTSHSFQIAVV
jgi:hypothetical protein